MTVSLCEAVHRRIRQCARRLVVFGPPFAPALCSERRGPNQTLRRRARTIDDVILAASNAGVCLASNGNDRVAARLT